MTTLAGELRKLPAFVRRDFLVAWSYRLPFVTDWIGLAFQALMFYFVGLMVDTSKLPTFGGQPTTYLAFVSVGIAISASMTLALGRVSAGQSPADRRRADDDPFVARPRGLGSRTLANALARVVS